MHKPKVSVFSLQNDLFEFTLYNVLFENISFFLLISIQLFIIVYVCVCVYVYMCTFVCRISNQIVNYNLNSSLPA